MHGMGTRREIDQQHKGLHSVNLELPALDAGYFGAWFGKLAN